MINRESYLSQLIKLRDQDLIKVVTGIRRCGKSTLLMAFRQYLYANGVQKDAVLSLNFEEREYYQVAYTANDENTLKREISSLRKIKDTYPKYLLTTDFDNANIDGIRKINVIDWVLGSRLI